MRFYTKNRRKRYDIGYGTLIGSRGSPFDLRQIPQRDTSSERHISRAQKRPHAVRLQSSPILEIVLNYAYTF